MQTVKNIFAYWRESIRSLAGQAGSSSINTAIELVLLAVVLAAVAGTALTSLNTTDTASWDAGAAALWEVISVFVVIGFIYLIWSAVKGKS